MQKQVTLNPGGSEKVSFLVAPTIQDTYSVQLDGLAGTFEAVEAVPFDPWVYDIDGSCYIEISEQLKATDDYIKGLITIDQLYQVKDLFEGNIRNPACLIFDPWAYDTNGSSYIEINEQLAAVNDYIAGLITIDQLNQVKYLFENNIPH